MRQISLGLSILLIAAALGLSGCGSSHQTTTTSSQEQTPPPPPAMQKPADRYDTVDVSTQNKKVDYPPPATMSGNFTVQVGAYKLQESAERIAALAKERFSRNVSVEFDNASSLYKVMVGSFSTKDDARRFRDQMMAQYPTDYKDAWVSELPQK